VSAIEVRPARDAAASDGSADWMPFSTRIRVARELNALWEEFVTEMYDGPLMGAEVAEKFWKFVTTRGRPS
jgi:hypothetical protein